MKGVNIICKPKKKKKKKKKKNGTWPTQKLSSEFSEWGCPLRHSYSI